MDNKEQLIQVLYSKLGMKQMLIESMADQLKALQLKLKEYEDNAGLEPDKKID